MVRGPRRGDGKIFHPVAIEIAGSADRETEFCDEVTEHCETEGSAQRINVGDPVELFAEDQIDLSGFAFSVRRAEDEIRPAPGGVKIDVAEGACGGADAVEVFIVAEIAALPRNVSLPRLPRFAGRRMVQRNEPGVDLGYVAPGDYQFVGAARRDLRLEVERPVAGNSATDASSQMIRRKTGSSSLSIE